MMTPSSRWMRLFAILTLAGLSLAGVAKTAKAQLYSTDPYDPYGRAFRSFAYPGASDGPYGPGAGPPRRAPAANQFDRLGEELGLSGTRGGRYDASYRRFDDDFGRNYVPNEKADAQFIKDREKREQDMIRAMRERDPKKRALLLQEADADTKRLEADLGGSYRRGASTGPTTRAPSRRTSPSASVGPAGRAPVLSPNRTRSTTPAATTRSPNAVPPAPPSGRRALDSKEPKPSDVLERSREKDRVRPPITSPRRAAPATSAAPR